VKFDKGWIKVHRKVLLSDIAQKGHLVDLEMLGFWTYILINCNIYESKIRHGYDVVNLPAGGMAFSIKGLAETFEISRKKAARILQYLNDTERIVLKTSNKGSYLIVKKWEQYQIHTNLTQEVKDSTSDTGVSAAEHQRNTSGTQNREYKKIRKKNNNRKKKTTNSVKNSSLITLDFLSGELQEFISGVSDSIRLKWLDRYSKETINSQLLAAKDWSEAKGRKPKNVALLMNTFFKDTPHDKWKDTSGGVDPEEKALADEFNSLLEAKKEERNGNA